MNKVISPAQIDLTGMDHCVNDARDAALDRDAGPADPVEYFNLLGRLESAHHHLPPIYAENVSHPFAKTLRRMGENGFNEILLSDPTRKRGAALMLDIAHAILQNAENYAAVATDGFQEVVSDLYDGFLSAEDRRGIPQPESATLAGLVKWGRPHFGPYTWTVDATTSFGVHAPIVSLPPANSKKCIVAWAALGHETVGHDVLHAYDGLYEELSSIVSAALITEGIDSWLASYWADRIDETASDVLGILNMGPAAGIGLIAYFRGLNAAYTGLPALRNDGPVQDSHPADILRGYLAAAVTRLLRFDKSNDWARAIELETDRDAIGISILGNSLSKESARACAEVVAKAIATTKLVSLSNHSFDDMQTWRNQDDEVVAILRTSLRRSVDIPEDVEQGIYAAHVVSAAVLEALGADSASEMPALFDRMVAMLKIMHDANPSWGPLYVAHPGAISRHIAYQRHESPTAEQISDRFKRLMENRAAQSHHSAER